MPMISSLCALLALGQSGSSIEVPFRIGEDAIIVDVKVNGTTVSLMFDTGYGGALVLNDSIDIGKPSGFANLQDFVGVFQVPTVAIKTLSIGAKKVDPKDMLAVQQPVGRMSFAYNTHMDGIMGFEVIKSTVTEINFEHNKFIFYPSGFDITKRVGDNKRTFLEALLPIGHNAMEMKVEAKNGNMMTLALDTGNAFYATTHRDVLERVGIWPVGKQAKYMSESGVASGAVDSFEYLMHDAKIFGVPVKTSVWDVIDRPSSSAEGDGTIGFRFLKNFNIVIDYEHRRVWLENFTGKVENDPEGDVGLRAMFSRKENGVVVVYVSPDSPAEKAGIKVGDTILSIDGEDLSSGTYRQVEKKIRGPKGSKIKLAISHEGNVQRIELERAYLINDPGSTP